MKHIGNLIEGLCIVVEVRAHAPKIAGWERGSLLLPLGTRAGELTNVHVVDSLVLITRAL